LDLNTKAFSKRTRFARSSFNARAAPAQLPLTQGHFYLCGPVGFMAFAKQQLLALGVAPSQIHYEVFGPHNEL